MAARTYRDATQRVHEALDALEAAVNEVEGATPSDFYSYGEIGVAMETTSRCGFSLPPVSTADHRAFREDLAFARARRHPDIPQTEYQSLLEKHGLGKEK